MEGYLKKDGFVFASRRYFVLSGSNLSCYNGKGEREAREIMTLSANSTVTEIKPGAGKLRFKVKTDGTTWALSADDDNEAEARKWVEALTVAVQRLGQSSASPSRRVVVIDGTEFVLDPRYEIERRLGHGAYGVVVSAKDTTTGKRVAIKKCFNIFQSLSDAKKIAREIRLLRQMDHPNIIKIVTVVPPLTASFDEVYIVGELMDIDMHNLLYQSREKITAEHVQFFVYQLLCGLKYLHALNVIHRDLKPSNLLVNANCDLRICDFGLARGIHEPNQEDELTAADAAGGAGTGSASPPAQGAGKPGDVLSEYVVTRWYRAPEVLLNPRNYGKPIDVWSVGTILGELLGRKPMFPANTYDHLLRLQMRTLGNPSEADIQWITRERARAFVRSMPNQPRKDFRVVYPDANPQALDLIEKLLQWDPAKRPTAAQALAHPYFDDIREAEFEVDPTAQLDWANLEEQRSSKQNLQRFLLTDIVSMNPEASYLLAGVAEPPRTEVATRPAEPSAA